MNIRILKIMLLVAGINSSVNPGVYVLLDTPFMKDAIERNQQVIKEAVAQDQTAIACRVAGQDGSYNFYEGAFAPHLSLAFISQDELSVAQTEERFPELDAALSRIAEESGPIDLSDSIANASLEYWLGKFQVDCGGSKKSNYLNVVLKVKSNPALAGLVARVTQAIKETTGAEQRFPFSAHFTLGRICEAHDGPVQQLVDQLPRTSAFLRSDSTHDLLVRAFS